MKNPTIFFVFLLSCASTSLYCGSTRLDSIVLRQDSIVVRQDSIVVWEESTVVRQDSTVVRQDSTVVWEDSTVVWEENCVRKIAVFPDEKYSCQMWKLVIRKNSFPGKKGKIHIFFLPCVHVPAGAFLTRKIRKNILPCVHSPAGAFFWWKNRFLKICDIKIRQNR